jgi:hypothetical protein
MDLIDRIGPYLGIVAFAGLALLAFLVIQQAREVRRLREWAGRAPERAGEAGAAAQAAAEARGEQPEAVPGGPTGRAQALWERFKAALEPRWQELDRRSPVDPRILVGGIAVAALAAGVLTGGYGVLGGDDGKENGRARQEARRDRPPEVAVLNGTQVAGVQGVPGLAAKVLDQVVTPAGYRPGPTTDAPTSAAETVIMFEQGEEEAARELASDVEPELGPTPVQPITDDVRQTVNGNGLVIVLGQDEAQF